MEKVNTFNCKIINEYGDNFPHAVVALLDIEFNSRRGRAAEEVGGDITRYQEDCGASMRVMYWSSLQNKEQGYRSRPLNEEDGEKFTSVLTIDIDNPEVQRIMASSLPALDKENAIAMAELNRRFS